MNVLIQPSILRGSVRPPSSKSQGHRAVLAQALAGGGKITHLSPSQDIDATKKCVKALMRPRGKGLPVLDCGESGSTLRFLIPLALVLRGGARFVGRGRLMERPLDPYFELFAERGIFWERNAADASLRVEGTLPAGEYRIRGDISSQFVTGLLYALPLLEGDSVLQLTTPLESQGYVQLTLDVLQRYGVQVKAAPDMSRFEIPGGQRYQPADMDIEADWSQAAFWLAARNLGCDVRPNGLSEDSHQGDRVIAEHAALLAEPGDRVIDVSQCPDLVPPLAAMAAVRRGSCQLVNAARLRIKESDRLAAVSDVLTRLGAEVQEFPDSLTIVGKSALAGGADVSSYNDHRIAMMTAVLAIRCAAPVRILNAQCVAKSYPKFWDTYERMHGRIQREEDS